MTLNNYMGFKTSILHLYALTFFMMPVFLLENVVYRRNLFSMYSILIFTRPLVFLPLDGETSLTEGGEKLSSTNDR